MSRLILAVAMTASLATGAWAQNVALVDPSISTPQIRPVVDRCELVATTQSESGSPYRGECIGATADFISSLRQTVLPTSGAAFDKSLTDLVLGLEPLPRLNLGCNSFDDEVARAIKLASEAATEPRLAEQLMTLSRTIASCQVANIAAIPVINPASGEAPL